MIIPRLRFAAPSSCPPSIQWRRGDGSSRCLAYRFKPRGFDSSQQSTFSFAWVVTKNPRDTDADIPNAAMNVAGWIESTSQTDRRPRSTGNFRPRGQDRAGEDFVVLARVEFDRASEQSRALVGVRREPARCCGKAMAIERAGECLGSPSARQPSKQRLTGSSRRTSALKSTGDAPVVRLGNDSPAYVTWVGELARNLSPER